MKIEYSDLVPFSWAEDTDLESAKAFRIATLDSYRGFCASGLAVW